MDPVTDNFIMTADADDPGKTESADGSSVSDNSADKENEGGSDNPENPDDPETPDDPDISTPSDSVSDNTLPETESASVSENTIAEDGISLLADDGAYGTLTDYGTHGANGDNLLWKYYADTKTLVICPNPESANPGGEMKAEYPSGSNLRQEWMAYRAQTEKVVVEDGVTSLSRRAFMNHSALEEIWLPESLTVIGISAFDGVTTLKKINPVEGGAPVNFPSGVEELRDWAFYGCTSLGAAGEGDNFGCVRLSEKLSKLGYGVFQNNTGITSIWFDDGITSLQLDNSNSSYGIFQGCTNLQELHFPNALTSLTINGTSDALFKGCTSLAELTVPGGIVTVPKGLRLDTIPNLQTLTLGSGITAVEGYNSNYSPFPKSLEELNLPRGFPTIQNNMCKDLSKLQRISPVSGGSQINFPEGITTIGNDAFSGCSLLGTAGEGDYTGMIRFPASLTSIGQNAFLNDTAIRSIVMNDGAAADESLVIGRSAFQGNTSLESVHFGDGKKEMTISSYAFYRCAKLGSLHFPENLETLTVENMAYSGCTALEELYLPGSLKTVTRNMGLSQLTGLKKLTFGPGMETAERGSIYNTTTSILPSSLEELYLPEGFRAIPVAMCNGFTNLKKINPVEGGSQINFPEGLQEIGENAFYGCKQLGTDGGDEQIVVSFPKSLKQIGVRAFSGDSQLTELQFDSPLSEGLQIQQYAFQNCSGLAGELRLPDGLVDLGAHALWGTEYRTALWTPLTPFQAAMQFRSDGNEITFEEIRFRGTDDRDEIQVGDKTVSWSSFYEVFIKQQTYNRNAPEKLHIEDTVKRLASDTFWKDFEEVTFHGKNVITLDHKGMFASASASVRNLEGTYYVTEEGALYLLDENTKQAALAYCPPGVTTLTIPDSVFVTDELTGVYEKRYNGTYSVTSVLPHAIIEARNLNEINAANPKKITLGMRAFADCPTLRLVNGVTTQREANALFGAEGTSARKFAFVNTGLSPDEDPEEKGRPQQSLFYKDGAGSTLKITAHFVDGVAYPVDYEDDAWRLRTGEKVRFDIDVSTNADTRFRIYFQPSDSDFEGFIKGDATGTATSTAGIAIPTTLTTGYDAVAGSYYCEFRLSAGATMSIGGGAGSEGVPALYPAQVDNGGSALNLSKGGDLCVWAELVQDTSAPSEEPVTGADDYMMLHWGTERTEYQVNVRAGGTVAARIDTSTGKPTFQPQSQYDSAFKLGSSGFQLKPDPDNYNDNYYRDVRDPNNLRWRGRDPVKQICWRYQVLLPEGMEWKTAEEIAARWYSYYGVTALEAVEVSADKRTLTIQYTDVKSDVGDPRDSRFSLVPSQWNVSFDQDMVVREDYDYFTDSQIVYDCSAVVYYQFSEPEELSGKQVTDILKGMEPGEVTFVRSTGLDEENRFGADMREKRGCTVINTFWAHNASAAPAPTGLTEITDTLVCGENGSLYLTAGQMAAILLEENSAIRVREIWRVALSRWEGKVPTACCQGTGGFPAPGCLRT